MDILDARQQLRFRSIYDLPLRVTFYARVSSESDEQLNSLGNQIQYYRDLIGKNPSWTFVEGYVDEGISAATTRNRENFHRMVEDGKDGDFDLIITKEITRFARNTLDSIKYTRELLSAGVAVFFQNDNINTLDEDSELRLTIMSGIAQDELRKLSSRVKFGHQQAIKNKVVLGSGSMYGYHKENGRLTIDEEEAPMIRELFELYAGGEYSLKQIENMFWKKGYRNRRGNRLLHSTISNMIANPKYKGYYVGNKVKVVDLFTKKQKFLSPDQWVMFKDETGEIVPAIVSEEIWDRANELLKRRSEDVKRRKGECNHANLLTGKLLCTHCGTAYYRRETKDRKGNKNSKWVCSGKINGGADSCPSFPIYEEEIKVILAEVFRDTEDSAKAMVAEYVQMYNSMNRDGSLDKRIRKLENLIETTEKKKQKLLTFNAMGQLDDQDFLAMNKQCSKEIKEAQNELADLMVERENADEFKFHLERIKRTLKNAQRDASAGIITPEFVSQYIDKIYAEPQDDGSICLKIKIFTGDTTECYLSKLKGRTGHTFKKMIQAYENGMK